VFAGSFRRVHGALKRTGCTRPQFATGLFGERKGQIKVSTFLDASGDWR
jgi:hypothetical protein